MKQLGQRHSRVIVQQYHRILGIDLRYLSTEPFQFQDDMCYVGKVILIASACQTDSPSMDITERLDRAPFYLEKHLDYLRDKYEPYFSTSDPNLKNRQSLDMVAPSANKLQRANSLNINFAYQHLLSRLTLCLKDINLKELLSLTKNSYNQILKLQQNHQIQEISHNHIDQCLANAHIFSRVLSLYTTKNIGKLFKEKIKQNALFGSGGEIGRQINIRVMSKLFTLLQIFLEKTQNDDVFEYRRFKNAIEGMVEFSEKHLCKENALKDPILHILIEKIHLQDQTQICKKEFRKELLKLLLTIPKISSLSSPNQLIQEIEHSNLSFSSISAPNNREESCILFNSRHLEYIKLRVNSTHNSSQLCFLYPDGTIKFHKANSNELFEINMNGESWNQQQEVRVFSTREDYENNLIYQITRNLVGDVMTGILYQQDDNTPEAKHFFTIQT